MTLSRRSLKVTAAAIATVPCPYVSDGARRGRHTPPYDSGLTLSPPSLEQPAIELNRLGCAAILMSEGDGVPRNRPPG